MSLGYDQSYCEFKAFDVPSDSSSQSHNKTQKPLDFETKKAYTFKVEASNLHLDHRFHSAGPFKDTATVKISVLDVDEPPVFSKPLYTMEVYEDTPFPLEHTDFAIKKLSFTLFFIARYFIDWKSDGDSYFTIDGNEGTIATNELLDRESTAQYNFSIIASKVSKYGMDRINVILQFFGFKTLKRVPAEMFFIFGLTAEWSRGETQKPVRFPHSKSLTHKPINREGNPLLTSKVNILINVLDVNEFPPEISVPYETAVCENAKPGQIIQIVSATDRDLSPAGQQFSFRLSPEAAIKPNFTVRDFRSKCNHRKIYLLSCIFV
ncbi:hypothetical protein H8958_014703, partial [Nasalis larvatus]